MTELQIDLVGLLLVAMVIAMVPSWRRTFLALFHDAPPAPRCRSTRALVGTEVKIGCALWDGHDGEHEATYTLRWTE